MIEGYIERIKDSRDIEPDSFLYEVTICEDGEIIESEIFYNRKIAKKHLSDLGIEEV